MTDARVPGRARQHLAWVVPLALVPVVFLAFLVLYARLSSLDAVPEWMSTIAMIGVVVGPAVTLVIAILAAERVYSSARRRALASRRADERPSPGHDDTSGFYETLAHGDAARRGLSPEEYGVYKGGVGSLVKPVNSAGGLLLISLLLTTLVVFEVVLIGVVLAQDAGLIARNPDTSRPDALTWFLLALTSLAPIASWHYYRIERRAQKLRISRGLPRTISADYVGDPARPSTSAAMNRGTTSPEPQHRGRKARRNALLILVALSGPIMITVGSVMISADDDLRQTGSRTTGTIGAVLDGREASTHDFRVDFLAEDESPHTVWGSWSPDEKPSVGDSVTVIYRSSDPDSAVLDEDYLTEGDSLVGFGSILTLIAVVIAVPVFIASRRVRTRPERESRPGATRHSAFPD
jgi:hypothetical protein